MVSWRRSRWDLGSAFRGKIEQEQPPGAFLRTAFQTDQAAAERDAPAAGTALDAEQRTEMKLALLR